MLNMSHETDNPNYKNTSKYMPKKFDKDLYDNGEDNTYDSLWFSLKDVQRKTITRQAVAKLNISESNKSLKDLLEECSCDDDEVNEEGDNKTAEVISSLGATDWGKDNEAQMKAVQLLKGLAVSDDPKSNEFMKKLSSASTSIAKELS